MSVAPSAAPARYLPCPLNGWLHEPVALRIARDGKKHWPTLRCPICRFRAFLPKHPKVETHAIGLEHAEAKASGFVVLGCDQ